MDDSDRTNYEDLLNYSLKMLHRGDSFVSIHNFLIHKNATEEESKKIFLIIKDEKNKTIEIEREIEREIDKNNFLKSSFIYLLGGIVIMIVSWFFYLKGLDSNAIMFIPIIALIGGAFIFLISFVKIITTFFFRKN